MLQNLAIYFTYAENIAKFKRFILPQISLSDLSFLCGKCSKIMFYLFIYFYLFFVLIVYHVGGKGCKILVIDYTYAESVANLSDLFYLCGRSC